LNTAFPLRHYVSIDSTNAEAHRLVESGEQGPLWIAADEQLAGRGRLGRTWVSKPGNLYATLILPCVADMSVLPQLSFVAALAIQQAASGFVNSASISLKWPNDCLLDGAKFSGILIESLKPGLVALGMGINISHAPEGLPYRAACLVDYGCKATLPHVHAKLDEVLRHWLSVWNLGTGFADIRARWTAACGHMGKPITVRLPEGEVRGQFTGLAEDGAMLLKVDGNTRKIHAGDVVAH
jgi:BirA family biotin operon repressor/biotin-[acetyl-CoA-carboxylase] ligase